MTTEPATIRRRRADALLSQGRAPEAVPLYRDLVRRFPDEESHQLALAWALYDSGEAGEAVACFEELAGRELARGVFTGFAFDELVRIYRGQKAWEKLISLCERTAAAFPDDPAPLRTLGEACLDGQRPGQALAVFRKLTALEPDEPSHWCNRGDALLALGEPRAAEAAYERAIVLAPEEAPQHLRRLSGLLGAAHPERALAVLGRCQALDPGRVPDFFLEGDLSLRLGRHGEAEAAYGRAAADDPPAAGAIWHRLGLRCTEAGLHEQAARGFAKAAQAEPGNPRHLLRLAAAYASQGRADLAVECLKRAGETLPGKLP